MRAHRFLPPLLAATLFSLAAALPVSAQTVTSPDEPKPELTISLELTCSTHDPGKNNAGDLVISTGFKEPENDEASPGGDEDEGVGGVFTGVVVYVVGSNPPATVAPVSVPEDTSSRRQLHLGGLHDGDHITAELVVIDSEQHRFAQSTQITVNCVPPPPSATPSATPPAATPTPSEPPVQIIVVVPPGQIPTPTAGIPGPPVTGSGTGRTPRLPITALLALLGAVGAVGTGLVIRSRV